MKCGHWIGSVDADYTHGRIPQDDSKGAMSLAMFKVSDGLNEWYTPVDSAQWANGVYRPQGIEFMPQGNGRGASIDQARQEGVNAGRHAAACGSPFILDLEPDPSLYWHGIAGTGRAFCEGFASTANGNKLRINPDARNPGINLDEWVAAPVVDIWYPQMYAATFGESQERWERLGIQPLLDLGIPKSRIHPMVSNYMNGAGDPSMDPDTLEASIRYYADRGYGGITVFRRQTEDGRQVERLLSMADPFAPPAPPVSHPVGRETRLIPMGEPVYSYTEVDDERIQTQRIKIVRDA